MEALQSVIEEGRPHTPVVVKIKRWNKRIKEELEGGEAGVRTPRSKSGRKEGPTGKEKLLQPTLSLFLSLRSRFKGSGGKRARQVPPSHESNQEVTGQGPPTGPNAGDLQIFGEGVGRPRVILGGSPEHNLLREAQVLEVGGSRSQEKIKEGRGFSGGHAKKLVR